MHYTVYKTTNLANGKIYIGSHVTEDVNDGYVGSGKLLLKAIEKYGLESFKKEVLHIFDNPNDMFLKEAELVSNEFIQRKDTYNIKEGGHGGWDYVNKNNLNFTQEKNARISGFKKFTKEQRIEYAKKATEEANKFWKRVYAGEVPDPRKNPKPFLGKKHTEETKIKMREAHKKNADQKGSKNSQFGTKWINKDGAEKKIDKNELTKYISEGWNLGRGGRAGR